MVKSDIASMTALNSATSPRISFAVSVVMLATWLVTAQTAREVPIGTMVASTVANDLLALVMPLTVRWR